MDTEIERKFLLKDDSWRREPALQGPVPILQGYLSRDPQCRVRIMGDEAFLTIKGKGLLSRSEFEYEIPKDDAKDLLMLCGNRHIAKYRYRYLSPDGLVWEIDEFQRPETATIAEIEIPSEDWNLFLPPWVGEEVTDNPTYYNVNM